VICLDTEANGLPQGSVAVHVSVIVPPQTPGAPVKVDRFETPVIKHPPLNPFVNGIVLAASIEPQSTVVSGNAVMVGNAAGLTVIILDTDTSGLPHTSVAVHVSVTVPPHAPGVALNVDGLDVPVIKHPPLPLLVYVIVLAAGIDPQATVIAGGAVMIGSAAGLTVIVLDTGAKGRPHASVAVHVSVTVPPHAGDAPEIVEGLDVPVIRHPPVPLLV
jgi:hypothetical protein